MDRKEKAKKRWQTIKSKGLKIHLLKKGIFVYGLMYFILFTFVSGFINSNYSFSFFNESGFI